MRLPVKILLQIIDRPVARFSGSGHKRALGRIELQTPATIFPIEDELIGTGIHVTLKDISAETAGMSAPQALMPFSSFLLSIPMREGPDLFIRCRVTRCVRGKYGEFALAADFVQIVDPKKMRTANAHRA
jgi:hypothetical protein